ncbi:hypothetical protein N0V84_003906 [Fusarium piperis]|uniref:Uncharacterized protein n=1 Tax=Fusarium piperis TaxID=1435070 RepID=A0A9W8WGG0_9HYPO|nr:hypothetical protein N0V84_003906 [Fusarium piperis]
MKALRIKHLPWYHECFTYPEEKVQKIKEEREWDERLDEDRILIEELDELTQEFEQEFANQNLSIEDFLQLHWRPRIRQVQREHKQALDESQRQQLRQIGVVLDGEREKDVDSEDEDSEDEDSEDEDSEDFEDEDFEDEDSGDEDSGDEDARGDIRDREASE